MTKGELLNLLEQEARYYGGTARDSIQRNMHMNELTARDLVPFHEDPERAQRIIDALIVDFINTVAHGQSIDYGLHVTNLKDHATR